jgi:hypothetical protein
MFIVGEQHGTRDHDGHTPPKHSLPTETHRAIPIYHRSLPPAGGFHSKSVPIIVAFSPYSRAHYLFGPLLTGRLSLPTALRL